MPVILLALIIAPCLVLGLVTYGVLRAFDLPLPSRPGKPKLNVDASSRVFVVGAGALMSLWIVAWLALLVFGMLKLYGV